MVDLSNPAIETALALSATATGIAILLAIVRRAGRSSPPAEATSTSTVPVPRRISQIEARLKVREVALTALRDRAKEMLSPATARGDEEWWNAMHGAIKATVEEAHLEPLPTREALLEAWRMAISAFLEDHYLTPIEETLLDRFADRFEFTLDERKQHSAIQAIYMGRTAGSIAGGGPPPKGSPVSDVSIVLQKGELIFWRCSGVVLLQDGIQRSIVGGSTGVSVRVAPGVYTRVGAFRGHPVETTNRKLIDTGTLALTAKGVYFDGAKAPIVIPYSSIISVKPQSDGVSITKKTGKPYHFVTGDMASFPGLYGWFLHAVIANLAARVAG